MRVWALWHGGAAYTAPDEVDDVEEFDTLSAAGEEFRSRACGRAHFRYVSRPRACVDTPAVGTQTAERGGPSMRVWFRDFPEEMEPGDIFPDRIIEFDPEGGLRITPPKDD